MHDPAAVVAAQHRLFAGHSGNPRYAELHRHYPSIDYLRRRARRRIPHFAFEYADGGAGNDDAGIRRNWAALDAIELVPRYGVMPSLPSCDVELFGRRYCAPIGVAPMGGPAIVWPGADLHLARAAQHARIPYTLAPPAAPRSNRSPRSPPTSSGFSFIASPGTAMRSASTWCGAPKPPAAARWC